MKTTIETNNFIEKLSTGSDHHALYARGKSYSYGELANKLNQLKNEFYGDPRKNEGGTLLLNIIERSNLLITVLALLGDWQKIVLVIGTQTNEHLREIALENQVNTIISDTDFQPDDRLFFESIVLFTLDANSTEAPGSAHCSTFQVEITSSAEILFISERDATPLTVTFAELLSNVAQLNHQVSASDCDTYLICGALDHLPLIQESLWALHNGLHLIFVADEKELLHFLKDHESFKMDFGLFFFGSYSQEEVSSFSYHWLLDMISKADRENYTAVWTPERHFNPFGGLFPNPSVLSAAIAVATDQIQIRCGSIVAPLHHSVRIAEDWSLIDNLSNGRVGVSFASGWQCNDFVFFPDRYKDRHQFMLQQIEEVRHLWKGGRLDLKNGLEQSVSTEIYPKPVQETLPVWVTVSGKTETFVDAGKIGANILTHLLWQDANQLVGKIAAYRKSLKDSGYDPKNFKVSVMAHTFMGADDESVREIVKEPLKSYIKSSVSLIETMTKGSRNQEEKDQVGRYGVVGEKISDEHLEELLELAFDRFFDQAGLLGSPEKCHRFLKKLKSYDVDEVACLVDFGVSQDEMSRSIDVLSAFRKDYENTPLLTGKAVVLRSGKDMEMPHALKITDEILADKLLLVLTEGGEAAEADGKAIVRLDYSIGEQGHSEFTVERLRTRKKADSLSEVIDEEF